MNVMKRCNARTARRLARVVNRPRSHRNRHAAAVRKAGASSRHSARRPAR